MKLLIFGDIFWRNGRRLIEKFLPDLKKRFAPDFIIGNSENLTSGKGPIPLHIRELQSLGFDVLTGGNHTFSQIKDLAPYLWSEESIQIRPANYFEAPGYPIPGVGHKIFEKNGMKLLVINLLSDVFLGENVYNPFLRADEILATFPLSSVDAIVVDFHRETTAEAAMLSMYLDGRTSLVYGTHTHIQTNDERVLPKGTWMITDVGFSGAENSSIGHTFESRIGRFLTGTWVYGKGGEQDLWPGVVYAIFAEIISGKCVHIEKIRIRESML